MVTVSRRMRQVGHLTCIMMSEMQAKFNLENFLKTAAIWETYLLMAEY